MKKLWLVELHIWPTFVIRAKSASEALKIVRREYPQYLPTDPGSDNTTFIYISEISLSGDSEIIYQSDDL